MIYCLTFLEAGIEGVVRVMFPIKPAGSPSCVFLDSGGELAIFGVPWLVAVSLQSPPSHSVLPVCVFTWPFFYKNISHAGLEAHLN